MNNNNTGYNKKVTIQYLAIPESDWDWIGSQPGFVVTLWRESWSCDRYGNRWVEITPSLSNNRFLTAKKILESAKLFEFKSEKLTSDGRKVSKWLVRNLHGCRVDSFWSSNKKTTLSKRRIQYHKFLKSPYWLEVRDLVLDRDNYTCQSCGIKTNLQVHHLTYQHHRDEKNYLEDLITLCKCCHKNKHR